MFTCRTIITTTINSFRTCIVNYQMPFYAVRRGKCPGIYKTWAECKSQVDQYVGARYKKFDTQVQAQNFINGFDSPAAKGWNDTSTPRKYVSKCSPGSAMIGSSSNQHETQTRTSAKLEVIDKEIEVLKEQLKMKEAEKNVLLAQIELEQLKEQCDAPGKSTPNKTVSHTAKPYDKSPTIASSSNWKQNRVTKMIDFGEARQIHTSASIDCDSSSGAPIIYTDGACVNNGTAHARAGIGVYWGLNHPLNVSERLPGRQTNNRAEIFAVVKAVQQAKCQGFSDITIKTDSQFLINSITKWVPGWKKKGWKTAAGKPVINKEDFETLLEEAEGVSINWVHVRGHQGIEGNEAADKLAVEGANKHDV